MASKVKVLIVSFSIWLTVLGQKCQQSLQYKKYTLASSAVTIKETKTSIKHQGVCAAFAVKGNYPSFMHDAVEEKCELTTVDINNIVDDPDNGLELYLDLEFREPTREGNQVHIIINQCIS